jgi:LmbE family N-acetylglucosaminyl deacetylase
MTERPDDWQVEQNILVILAHPDDPEFFCGATLTRWVQQGHSIHYFILTCGDKGGDPKLTSEQLCTIRHEEQRKAAAVLGVKSITFLDLEDGYLVPSLDLRRECVRAIRRARPDILVTCDPTLLYTSFGSINHPDHRAAGQVVLDAVFPAAGNPHFFPELLQEGLEPHTPREVWISIPAVPTVTLDVTATWPVKLNALKEHRSQIGDPLKFEERMRSRRAEGSTEQEPRFEERFRVIKYG